MAIGISSGGGGIGTSGGTSNHAELENLDYAHSGHTGFMSSENYIPKGTKITVKTDGTGDYTNLADAVDYLSGKWSNGVVTIELSSGTHTLSSRLSINGESLNIPVIIIEGQGKSDTTLQTAVADGFLLVTNGAYVRIRKMTAVSTHGTKADRAMAVQSGGILNVANMAFSNYVGYCPGTYGGGTAVIGTGIEISNCLQGINLESGIVNISWGASISFSNIQANCFWIGGGAILQGGNANITTSSVGAFSNVTPNTVSSDGIIVALSAP